MPCDIKAPHVAVRSRRNLADAAGCRAGVGAPLPRQLSAPWVRGEEWTGSLEEFEEAWAAEVARRRAPARLHA